MNRLTPFVEHAPDGRRLDGCRLAHDELEAVVGNEDDGAIVVCCCCCRILHGYIYMPSHTEKKKMDGSGSMGPLDLDFIILDMGTVTPVPCKVTTQHANQTRSHYRSTFFGECKLVGIPSTLQTPLERETRAGPMVYITCPNLYFSPLVCNEVWHGCGKPVHDPP